MKSFYGISACRGNSGWRLFWSKLKNAYETLSSFISSISEQSLKNDLSWHFTKDLIEEKNRSQCLVWMDARMIFSEPVSIFLHLQRLSASFYAITLSFSLLFLSAFVPRLCLKENFFFPF